MAREVTADAEGGKLRVDAVENRRRIIEASRELFAERGLDAPMKAIAARAGVGMATLYRRFPTRQDLLTEVFAEQFAECAAIVEKAVRETDAWRGLCSVVTGVAAMQAGDQGFSAAFVRTLPDPSAVERKLQSGMRGMRDLIIRAKRAGQLRADFAFADLAILLLANGGVVSQGGEAASAASQRLVAYMLQSFRADGVVQGPLPAPPELRLTDVVFPE